VRVTLVCIAAPVASEETKMITTTPIRDELVARLKGEIRGSVISPDHAEFDTARAVWNGMIDRRPGLIVRPAGAKDVAAAINAARDNGLLVAIKGGGHNVAGSAVADGALVIDLSGMRGVVVDPQARRVRAQGGALLSDIDAATQTHGLAVPVGVVSETGVAGLTLGGGLGWMRRKHGMSVDNLLSVEIVLADGRIVRANSKQNADLFWAVRGGGGNFGVVTEFEFQAHLVGPQVPVVFTFVPFEEAERGLRFFRDHMRTVPDELSTFAIFSAVPPVDDIPADVHGREAVIFLGVWCGEPSEAERHLAPLREFTTPLADLSGSWSYLDVQKLFDEDYPTGGRYYWKSQYADTMTDEVIEVLSRYAATRPSTASTIDLWHMGGAIARVAPDATAVPQRSAEYLIGIESNWTDEADDAANMRWARELWAETQSFSHQGHYVNFAGFGEEGGDLVRAAYGANYARLAQVKAKYDPANIFRVNQNILPAGA
jgi:FAD/FMN-containing dehydrogenase